MSKNVDNILELLKDVLGSYKEEHRELSETWKNLDSKAQGVIAIDGIFLAAIFAFVRALTLPSCNEKWLITIVVIIFSVSILLAVSALWIRSVPAAPIGDSLQGLVDDLLNSKDSNNLERFHNLSRDHSGLWKAVNIAVQKENEAKARLLVLSQFFLVVAITITTGLTVFKVWS